MNDVVSVDPVNRQAWVEPGMLNLDLSRLVGHEGLHFAPDPSSQQTCSIGGNVANNAGGPHCLAEGVTASHVLAMEVVLPDGTVTTLGGEDPEPDGYDLRGVFVGSEGMFGVTTKVCVKLTPNPPTVQTLLMDFMSVEDGAATVSDIIAAGIVPAAVEMMDRLCLEAVEAYIHAGLPVDAAAALLVEVVGLPHGVAADVARIDALARVRNVRTVRIAADDAERALLWKGRKSAFGAIARIKPNYYLHDTVVPRSKLPAVLNQVYEIAGRHDLLVLNVFHAGDGNLHPLLVFDKREPGVMERVHAAGAEIVRASVEAGGVLSGEHGIGLEKRDMMPLMFSPVDLAAQQSLRSAFDPHGRANPGKVLPSPATCADVQAVPEGAWI
jgi:glycolate oxidase subunit GlcD